VLYQYPEGKAITPDAAAFCFPHGVQPSMLERTPSMSALNELVYSQHYQHSDASSFIFVLKVGSSDGHSAADAMPMWPAEANPLPQADALSWHLMCFRMDSIPSSTIPITCDLVHHPNHSN
jgi:hypothetical protein